MVVFMVRSRSSDPLTYRRILEWLKYEIYYDVINKDIHIHEPIKVRHLIELKQILKNLNIEYTNIRIGRI